MTERAVTILRDGSFVDIDTAPAGELRRADDRRVLKVSGLTDGDQSEPIDCTGFDFLVYYIVGGSGTGAIALTVWEPTTASVVGFAADTAVAVYKAATSGAGGLVGFLRALPRQVLLANSGGPTSADVVVELRKRTELFHPSGA